MVFSDLFFLFVFLPSFAICYLLGWLLDLKFLPADFPRKLMFRNFALVVFSLIFYAWGEPVYVFLMLLSVLVNYLAGLGIANYEGQSRKIALVIGVVCNLISLSTFKYVGFFTSIFTDLGLPLDVPKIALPIGISFYTFQSISYLVDVYRKDAPVQYSFIDLLLYISMFPQLIAGPIVRYDTVAHQINYRTTSASDLSAGIYRFLIGLGKKVIIANQMSDIVSQFLISDINHLSTLGAWIGVIAFAIQIYFDFSGYSDMAIGLGRCLGFNFTENFNHPYCCDSITDFWRRWHISLGTFFRDYVYIPMGGNRRHQVLNILVVWFLTGMWHGASWNFILWGVYFGIIVTIEKYTVLRVKHTIPAPLLHMYSIFLFLIGWVIFYFDDFHHMESCFAAMFGHGASLVDFTATTSLFDNFWLWVVAILFCMPIRSWVFSLFTRLTSGSEHFRVAMLTVNKIVLSVILLVLSVALLVGATNNAFIYTRF